MRICICGGRDLDNYAYVRWSLNHLINTASRPTIITGGARGTDTLAIHWADEYHLETEVYPANWQKYGRSAGYIRNEQMLDTGLDLVIAFPGGKGTAMMVDIAKRAGVEVIIVPNP